MAEKDSETLKTAQADGGTLVGTVSKRKGDLMEKEAVEKQEIATTIEEIKVKLAGGMGENDLHSDERKILSKYKGDERNRLSRTRPDKLTTDELMAKLIRAKKGKEREEIIAVAMLRNVQAQLSVEKKFGELVTRVKGLNTFLGIPRSDIRKMTKIMAALLSERPGWTPAKVKKLIKTTDGEFDVPDEAFDTMEAQGK